MMVVPGHDLIINTDPVFTAQLDQGTIEGFDFVEQLIALGLLLLVLLLVKEQSGFGFFFEMFFTCIQIATFVLQIRNALSHALARPVKLILEFAYFLVFLISLLEVLRLSQLEDFARLLVDRGEIVADDLLQVRLQLLLGRLQVGDALLEIDQVARFLLW